MLPAELDAKLQVYRQATGQDAVTAVQRLIEIGLRTWQTDNYYMPERVCGRVRTAVRH